MRFSLLQFFCASVCLCILPTTSSGESNASALKIQVAHEKELASIQSELSERASKLKFSYGRALEKVQGQY
ncbi:MAG: hypothetical protein ACI9MB_005105 [Verrucomicrobiales bacterium]|jgi:hypothetical protein